MVAMRGAGIELQKKTICTSWFPFPSVSLGSQLDDRNYVAANTLVTMILSVGLLVCELSELVSLI